MRLSLVRVSNTNFVLFMNGKMNCISGKCSTVSMVLCKKMTFLFLGSHAPSQSKKDKIADLRGAIEQIPFSEFSIRFFALVRK